MQDDLWSAFDSQLIDEGLELPASIKTIMSSWSIQTGYPIVTIRRDYTSNSAILTQVYIKFMPYCIEFFYPRLILI